MERKQKGPRLFVLPEHVVTAYYRYHFDWERLLRQATCNGRYRLEQRVWWFICHNERPLKRIMFDTLEALRLYVIRKRVMVLHFSAISALGREGVAFASRDYRELKFMPHEIEVAKANAARGVGLGDKLTNKILNLVHQHPYSEFYKLQPMPGVHKDDLPSIFSARELIFDIDLNDYKNKRDPVCECGAYKRCCDACWDVFIARTAIPALKYMLGEWCGFKEILCTFSGRRGMHIQVQDERAMHMTWKERYQVFFVEMLCNKGNSAELRTHLLEVIYRPVFMECIAPKLPSPVITDELIFDYLHPRVDECFWTSDIGHNVKCPWSIHPATGNVLVEIYDGFKPSLAKRPDQMVLTE